LNTNKTAYGIVNIRAGRKETLATNQLWRTYSLQANGGLNICTKVSNDIAKKLPIARAGLVNAYVVAIRDSPATRRSSGSAPGLAAQ
jgi:hypothetical protein